MVHMFVDLFTCVLHESCLVSGLVCCPCALVPASIPPRACHDGNRINTTWHLKAPKLSLPLSSVEHESFDMKCLHPRPVHVTIRPHYLSMSLSRPPTNVPTPFPSPPLPWAPLLRTTASTVTRSTPSWWPSCGRGCSLTSRHCRPWLRRTTGGQGRSNLLLLRLLLLRLQVQVQPLLLLLPLLLRLMEGALQMRAATAALLAAAAA